MATAKVLLLKNKKRDTDTYPLALRVTKDRKPKYIFLGVLIKESDWNPAENKVRKSHPNSKRINNLIIKKLAEAEDLLMEDNANNRDLTGTQIKSQLKRRSRDISYAAFSEEQCSIRIEQGRIKDALSYKSQAVIFKEFMNGQDVFFQDITINLLEKYKSYLKAVRKSSDRTIVNHLIKIRTLYNQAIKEGIADQKDYPFGGNKIKIRIPDGTKIGLEEKEIIDIEKLDLPLGSGIYHTRNLWLFSFYFAGMRISDVLKTKWTDFHDGRLYYTMGKNQKPISVKIPEKVEKILEYYKDQQESETNFVFPDLKLADCSDPMDLHIKIHTASRRLNKYLKRIGKMAKIKKPLSNHISRHSFGNIAGDKISPQMLQKLYRHSDIKTTMGYQANFIHKEADDALDSVINF
jgi:integrase